MSGPRGRRAVMARRPRDPRCFGTWQGRVGFPQAIQSLTHRRPPPEEHQVIKSGIPPGKSSGAGQDRPPTLSDARLSAVLDTAVFPIIVIDEQARVLIYNKACETVFGYTAEEAIGRNVSMIMPRDEAARHDGYLEHYYQTGERRIIGIGRRVRGQHRDGSPIPVELAVGEAMTPAGRQFIGIMRDLRAEGVWNG